MRKNTHRQSSYFQGSQILKPKKDLLDRFLDLGGLQQHALDQRLDVGDTLSQRLEELCKKKVEPMIYRVLY